MFRSAPMPICLQEILNSNQLGVIPNQVQLMRTGKFYSPEYGDLEITEAMLNSFVLNFRNKVRGVDLAIDYSHNSEDVAAGWFKNLYLSENGQELWAEVSWTKSGEEVLTHKEFRYLSAEFEFDYQGNEGKTKFGPTLFGAGLTNRPFIKNMKPVIDLSEKAEQKENTMDEKDKKIAELEAQVAALKAELEKEKKPSAPPVSTPAAASEAGMPAPDAVTLDSMKAQISELQKQIESYQAKEKQFQEEKKLSEKKDAFNKLLSEGKAVEAQRDAFMKGDTVKFAENARPVNLSGIGSASDATLSAGSVDAQKEVLKFAEELVSQKKVKNLSEGVKKVLADNAELKKQYEQTFN
jgi:phage I-like protein